MSKAVRVAVLGSVLAGVPDLALAVSTGQDLPEAFPVTAGLLALLLTIVLLVVVAQVERLARGSAIAESVGYVIAAVLALAAAVLVGWVGRFLTDFSAAQARFAADLLVTASLALLIVYFLRVRTALRRYLAGSTELLAKMQAADEDTEREEERQD